MTDDDQRVDPRYDPAFQRGFEGQVRSGLRKRTSVRRSSLVSPAPYRAEEPEPDVEEYGVQDATQTRTGAEEEPEPAPEHVPVSSLGVRDLRRNPFLIALVAVGLVLTIGGIAWAVHARQTVADLATELDYWYLQASVVGAPLTIVAGIAVLAGVLFVAAARWNRRN
ncbi:MAG: hypothetical protein ABIQ01_01350 [Pseudolysinimonas sp.]